MAARKKKSPRTVTRAPAAPVDRQKKTAKAASDIEAPLELQCKPVAQTSDSDHDDGRLMTAEDIYKIFQLNPVGYMKRQNHTRNDQVRDRSNYQKHLDPDLRLNEVVFSPSLPMELAKIASNHVEQYKGKCENPLRMRTSPTSLSEVLRLRKVSKETGIIEGYQAMANRILPIVIGLLFQNSSVQGLRWSTELPHNSAIPDAAFMLDADALLPDQLRDVADLFPHLLLYEFKNLNFGTLEYMIAITEKSCDAEFKWTACTAPCLDHGMTGHRSGPDAKTPVVDLAVSDWKDTMTGAAHSLDVCNSKVVLKQKHRATAKDIIEQMWTELVANDATFIVLNAGNYEQIGYRSRVERKLYLSGPIDTTAQFRRADVGYVQVHIGLFIASLIDAIDRATYIKALECGNSLPLSWNSYEKGCRKLNHVMQCKEEVDIERLLSNCSAVSLLSTAKRPVSNSSYVLGEEYHRYPQLPLSDEAVTAGPLLGIRIQHQHSDTYIGSVINLAGRTFSDCVIIKTACGKNPVCDLLLEYSKYLLLGERPSHCRVPTTYGFFRRKDPPYAFMLLEHVGEPLYRTVGWITDEQQIDALKTLEYLHSMKYKHGNLSDRTMIIGKRKHEVYLMDLERMEQAPEDERIRERHNFIDQCRELKRRRNKGPTVLVGPIHDTSNSPQKVFSEITAWMEEQENCCPISELVTCLDWSGNWLEVELAKVASEAAETFQIIWEKRPSTLSKICCL